MARACPGLSVSIHCPFGQPCAACGARAGCARRHRVQRRRARARCAGEAPAGDERCGGRNTGACARRRGQRGRRGSGLWHLMASVHVAWSPARCGRVRAPGAGDLGLRVPVLLPRLGVWGRMRPGAGGRGPLDLFKSQAVPPCWSDVLGMLLTQRGAGAGLAGTSLLLLARACAVRHARRQLPWECSGVAGTDCRRLRAAGGATMSGCWGPRRGPRPVIAREGFSTHGPFSRALSGKGGIHRAGSSAGRTGRLLQRHWFPQQLLAPAALSELCASRLFLSGACQGLRGRGRVSGVHAVAMQSSQR